MTNAALRAYASAGRDAKIQEYLPLVQHLAARLPAKLSATLGRDDLLSAGILGLIQAVDTFDPARGASFKTHAWTVIRGAMLDELRRHDPVPRSRRDRVRQVARAEARIEERLGRLPTSEEIAQSCGLSVDQVEDTLVNAHGMAVLSLDETAPGTDGDTRRLLDTLRIGGVEDPSDAVARSEALARLQIGIAELPDRERQVIVLYYAEDARMKEIGEVLGITESRVCQLHAKALRRLSRAVTASPTSRSARA